jgi:hypothetical protein
LSSKSPGSLFSLLIGPGTGESLCQIHTKNAYSPVRRGETLAYDVHVIRTKARPEHETATLKATSLTTSNQSAGDGHNVPLQTTPSGFGREPTKSTLTPDLPELEEISQASGGLGVCYWIQVTTINN